MTKSMTKTIVILVVILIIAGIGYKYRNVIFSKLQMTPGA